MFWQSLNLFEIVILQLHTQLVRFLPVYFHWIFELCLPLQLLCFVVSEYSLLLLLCAFLLCYHLTTLGKRGSIHIFVQSHWSILPLIMSRKAQNGMNYIYLLAVIIMTSTSSSLLRIQMTKSFQIHI